MNPWVRVLVTAALAALLLPVIFEQAEAGPSVPVDLDVPVAPTPVAANGSMHLLYELHITNFHTRDLQLDRVEIVDPDSGAVPLATYEGAELSARLSRPGSGADLVETRLIGGGLRAVLFVHLKVNQIAMPDSLQHRLYFKPKNAGADSAAVSLESAPIAVNPTTRLVIGAPLAGAGWLAGNALGSDEHRRALIPVNGRARVAQRFAIDWVQIGADGQIARDDPSKNANWYGYGAEVLAVADAVVVDTKDGIAENDPVGGEPAVPITLETIGGNYVIVDLGGGYFAFYAHLQPGSLRVKIGDSVKRGQVLGLLGNSGNSDAPHLHFHVADVGSPLGAEGLPFVFEAFAVQGAIESIEVLENGPGWQAPAAVERDQRMLEMPVDNAVVRFD